MWFTCEMHHFWWHLRKASKPENLLFSTHMLWCDSFFRLLSCKTKGYKKGWFKAQVHSSRGENTCSTFCRKLLMLKNEVSFSRSSWNLFNPEFDFKRFHVDYVAKQIELHSLFLLSFPLLNCSLSSSYVMSDCNEMDMFPTVRWTPFAANHHQPYQFIFLSFLKAIMLEFINSSATVNQSTGIFSLRLCSLWKFINKSIKSKLIIPVWAFLFCFCVKKPARERNNRKIFIQIKALSSGWNVRWRVSGGVLINLKWFIPFFCARRFFIWVLNSLTYFYLLWLKYKDFYCYLNQILRR